MTYIFTLKDIKTQKKIIRKQKAETRTKALLLLIEKLKGKAKSLTVENVTSELPSLL